MKLARRSVKSSQFALDHAMRGHRGEHTRRGNRSLIDLTWRDYCSEEDDRFWHALRGNSSSSLLSSLELSDTTIYYPYIRALLGTAPHVW